MKKNIKAIYPLSPLQQGLLFHALAGGGDGAYFIQMSCRMVGDLDVLAFERAWEKIAERHDVFRTAFVWEEVEEPLQVVGAAARLPLVLEDWRGLSAEDQQKSFTAFLAADRERGLQLSKAPLARLFLTRTGEREHLLVWSFSHLLLDGWSTSIVLDEVFRFYRAFHAGEEPALDAPRPFRDYIGWLRRREPDRAEEFWRRRLAGFSTPTLLAETGASPLPKEGVADHAEPGFELSPARTEALSAFARESRLTLGTLAQAVWALVLARFTGQDDVLFGATVAGRPAELAGSGAMVGLFINTVPVRVRIRRDKTLAGWLQQLQAEQNELREHEHSSLTQVHGWSEVPRGVPLFESLLVFENYPIGAGPAERGPALEVRDVRVLDRTHFPITVEVSPRPAFSVRLVYDRRLLDGALIERALGTFRDLLEALLVDPGRTIDSLPTLTDAERGQLAVWNSTAAALPLDRTFVDLFAERAADEGDRIAAACAGETVTYRELAERSGRLAPVLRDHGVGPESVVPLLSARGLDFLTAVLAVLQAGGAYLPLDPRSPAQRLAQVLAQVPCRLALAGEGFAAPLDAALDLLPAAGRPRRLLLAEALALDAPAIAPARIDPQSLAYVIFTSGSTGVPKGAMIPHRGMLNHLLAKVADLGLTASDVVAQNASQSFDISVWQLLAPLLVGGRVEIFPDEVASDGTRLLPAAAGAGITVLETVPSLLRVALEEGFRRLDLAALRWLLVTGEAVPPELCRRWLALHPEAPMLNAYGPTECSDDVAHHVLAAPPEADAVRVPIGRPVANTRLFVLDRSLAPLPAGARGELYVAGAGVGRGYLGDPRRTAEVFVPDPFASSPGERLYKTGDRVLFRSDGSVEFLGRVDQQVKVRGFRIEIEEIEAVLAAHPAVGAAAVAQRQDASGQARLVAYVVPRPGVGLEVAELREHLRSRLPDPMVPSLFVPLDDLPRTAHGKVDRRGLPTPEEGRLASARPFVEPETPVEKEIAGLWAQVLGVERVGAEDDFFELGGHSLLATQLVSRLRAHFGAELSLADFFAGATVRGLAARIEELLLVESADSPLLDEMLDRLDELDEEEAERLLALGDRLAP